jgi:hypothetical protein
MKHLFDEDRFADWRLVYGEANGPDGSRIGHAWLEGGDQVFDAVLNQIVPFGEYRARYGAAPLVRFTRVEAAQAAVERKHFGPWT